MDCVKTRAEQLRRALGKEITRQSIEKKLELCGYKVLYYGDEANSKGNQMLELLQFDEGIIGRQAFTFPGGDGCDFVFLDALLCEEEMTRALLREWCHIRLKHPVHNRILGLDFHSEQEAACLAEAIFCRRKLHPLWIVPAGAAAAFLLVLLVLQLGGKDGKQMVTGLQNPSTEQRQTADCEPLEDSDTVYITKEKFHRQSCTYATDVGVARRKAVENGYGRCQLCLP